jgi:hypothetical protein
LLAEFDDYSVQEALRERLNDLHDDNARKVLKSLFATLDKRKRFVYSLASQDSPPETRVADALTQGAEAELDLVLSEHTNKHPNPHNVPMCNLVAYNTTHFEADRIAASNCGRTFAAGSHAESDFLDWTLRKALKYCTTIQVYDRLFGEHFRGNFEYSAKVFIRWLETIVADPSRVTLHIHCGLPSGNTDHFIKSKLDSFRRGRLATMPITVQFYRTADGEVLPHQRFVITDQFAIDLGRGMDCLDPKTRRNREGKFGFADPAELVLALRSVPAPSLTPVRF